MIVFSHLQITNLAAWHIYAMPQTGQLCDTYPKEQLKLSEKMIEIKAGKFSDACLREANLRTE